MDTMSNGRSQSDFAHLNVLHNCGMKDTLCSLGTLGGDPIASRQIPLNISRGVLSVDLSACMATSHEANKAGNSDVAFGTLDTNSCT